MAETPEPESLIVVGELEALLATVTVPEREPAVVGTKNTLNEVHWPAAREMGTVMPLMVKFVDGVICEIETAELPVLVKFTVWEVLAVPMLVDEKPSEVGDAERVRTGEVPVPESGRLSEEVGALLTSVSVAEEGLAVLGANPTVKGEEPPGATVNGRAKPE